VCAADTQVLKLSATVHDFLEQSCTVAESLRLTSPDVGLDLQATSHLLVMIARKFPGLDVRSDFHTCVFLS
jgi:hypothetical protein